MTIYICLAILFLAGDLWLKQWSFANVPRQKPVEFSMENDPRGIEAMRHLTREDQIMLIPDVLALRLTLNRGAVFGLGQGYGWVFVCFTVLALGAIAAFFIKSPVGFWPAHLSLMLIAAGALGNLYDRLLYPGVRDMLCLFPDVDLPFGWHWPGGERAVYPWIFNPADVYLLAGITVILVRYVLFPPREFGQIKT